MARTLSARPNPDDGPTYLKEEGRLLQADLDRAETTMERLDEVVTTAREAAQGIGEATEEQRESVADVRTTVQRLSETD